MQQEKQGLVMKNKVSKAVDSIACDAILEATRDEMRCVSRGVWCIIWDEIYDTTWGAADVATKKARVSYEKAP